MLEQFFSWVLNVPFFSSALTENSKLLVRTVLSSPFGDHCPLPFTYSLMILFTESLLLSNHIIALQYFVSCHITQTFKMFRSAVSHQEPALFNLQRILFNAQSFKSNSTFVFFIQKKLNK